MQKPVEYITVPLFLTQHVDVDRKKMKQIEFYYQLKLLYTCGCIKNYRKRYKELSTMLNMGESTLRGKIMQLKEQGLASSDKNHLYIRSKYHFSQWLGEKFEDSDLKENYMRRFKITKRNFKNFSTIIYATIIDNNLKQQKDQYCYKVFQSEVEKTTQKIKRGYRRTKKYKVLLNNINNFIDNDKKGVVNLIEDIKTYCQQYYFDENLKRRLTMKYFDFKTCDLNFSQDRNPYFTLSRKSIATLLGRNSKSWGHSLIKNLKKANLIDKDDKIEYNLLDHYDNTFIDIFLSINNTIKGKLIYNSSNNIIKLIYSNNISINNNILYNYYINKNSTNIPLVVGL